MKTKDQTWKIGLYIGYEPFKAQTRFSGDRASWTVAVGPVIVGTHPSQYESAHNPDRVTNATDRTDYHGLHLKNLNTQTYISEESDGTRRVFGWSTEYRDVFSVDLSNAERMAKTLKTIDRRLEATREAEGYPLSLIHISEPTRQAEISYAVFCL